MAGPLTTFLIFVAAALSFIFMYVYVHVRYHNSTALKRWAIDSLHDRYTRTPVNAAPGAVLGLSGPKSACARSAQRRCGRSLCVNSTSMSAEAHSACIQLQGILRFWLLSMEDRR
jgi:hypothetical protein